MSEPQDDETGGDAAAVADALGSLTPAGDCGHVTCEPGWSWEPRLTTRDLWVVVSGRGSALLGGRRTTLGTGSVLVLGPEDRGRVEQDPDDRLTVVFAHFHAGEPAAVALRGLPRPATLRHPRLVVEHLDRVVRLAGHQHPLLRAERALWLRQAVLEVLKQLEPTGSSDLAELDPRVSLVVDLLRRDPSARYTLAELGAVAGMSPKRLSALFSREVGVPLRAFAVRARMERAGYLLRETALTVEEISRLLGYGESGLFSRQFSAYAGMPPGRARVVTR